MAARARDRSTECCSPEGIGENSRALRHRAVKKRMHGRAAHSARAGRSARRRDRESEPCSCVKKMPCPHPGGGVSHRPVLGKTATWAKPARGAVADGLQGRGRDRDRDRDRDQEIDAKGGPRGAPSAGDGPITGVGPTRIRGVAGVDSDCFRVRRRAGRSEPYKQ